MNANTLAEQRRRPSRQALQRELRALARFDARDHDFAARLEVALEQAYANLTVPGPKGAGSTPVHMPTRRSRTRMRGLRVRLAAVAVALTLAVSAVLSYVNALTPTPAAAAQLVLHRAALAAAHLPPGHALHLVYRFTVLLVGTGRAGGTIDLWMQADARGLPVAIAETQSTDGRAGTPPIVDRRIVHGSTGQEYLARKNIIRTVMVSSDNASLFISGAQYFSTFARQADQQVRLLAPRTLDGTRVDAIEVTSPASPGYSIYFDARSYLLRGMDLAGGRGGSARLVKAATVPAAAVPPHTFTLNAPSTARTAMLAPSNDTIPADLPSVDYPALALVSLCNTPPAALTKAIAAGTASPLEICQATDPTVTRAALVAALTAAEKARMGLDESVALGTITPAQEAVELANLQTKLATWVSKPLTD